MIRASSDHSCFIRYFVLHPILRASSDTSYFIRCKRSGRVLLWRVFHIVLHVHVVYSVLNSITLLNPWLWYVVWRKFGAVNICSAPCCDLVYCLELGYNITEWLDRRLVKYIHNLLHTNNTTLQSIVNSKIWLCPNAVLSENYKYLCYKYKLGHMDWNMSITQILKYVKLSPSETQLLVCNTIYDFCQVRERVTHCDN